MDCLKAEAAKIQRFLVSVKAGFTGLSVFHF